MENLKVSEYIERYLNSKTDYKTIRNYKVHLSDFFKVVRDKEINELIQEDLRIRHSDFESFISVMQGEGKANSTINAKLTAIRGFFNYIKSRSEDFNIQVDINTDIFKSMQKVQTRDNFHGDFDYEEVLEFAELALSEDKQPNLKRLFILFSLATAYRKEEVLNVKWDDFILLKNGSYLLEVEGKYGKRLKRTITAKFFDELQKEKEDEIYVFPIDSTEIQRMKDRLCKKMNIPDKRKIVIHSIRGAAITRHYEIFKDIISTKEFANHKTVETTLRYIKRKEQVYTDVITMTEIIEKEDLSNLTHQELLNLIQNNKNLDFIVKSILINSKNYQ